MDKIGHLFNSLEQQELPKDFKKAVFLTIQKEKRKWILVDLIISSSASVLSLFAVVWASVYTISAFALAGFSEYASLFFSERASLFVYWKEIGLTLVESLPVFSLTVLLLTFVALLWFVGRTTRDTKNIIFLPAYK